MPATPYMNLDLPDPLVTLGPTWASLLNAAFGEVDSHDHTAGQGLPITPAAINVNDDLDFRLNSAVNVESIGLATLVASLGQTSRIQSINGNLYWTNAAGVDVALTDGNSLAAASGNIANFASPRLAIYDNAEQYVRFFVDANNMAGLDIGFMTMRQNRSPTAPSFSLTMPTTGMTPALNIAWQLPTTIPAASPGYGILAARYSTVNAAVLEYQTFDNSTIESVAISGAYSIRVKALGITTAQLADLNVTTAKIANLGVTTAKIADLGVTTAKLADFSVTTQKLADLGVTTAKIADLNVTTAKIAKGAVTGGVTGGVADGPLAYRTVATENIAELAITAAKIATSAVETAKIADGAVTPLKRARVYAEGYYTAPLAIPINLSAAYLAMTRTAIETADLTFNRPVTVSIQPDPGGAANIYDFSIENQNFGGGIKTAVIEVRLRNAASIIRAFRTAVTIKGNFIESIQPMTFVHYPQNSYSGCFVDLLIRGDGTDLWLYAFSNVWWSISQ